LAEAADGAEPAPDHSTFAMPDLWRLAIWGVGAAVTLAIAGFASMTATGHDRVVLALAQIRGTAQPSPRPLDVLAADENRQLAEAVRRMTADRDRLQARLATLERGLEDVTGSIARVEKVAQAAVPAPLASKAEPNAEPKPEPKAEAEAASAGTPAEDVTASIGTVPEQPVVWPAPGSQAQPAAPNPAPRTEFGVDLGGAGNFEALRALWTSSRQRHATLLEGLRRSCRCANAPSPPRSNCGWWPSPFPTPRLRRGSVPPSRRTARSASRPCSTASDSRSAERFAIFQA
jgi:hypothetical protein